MKRSSKTSYFNRAVNILRDNEGASLVLVTIISIIILTGIVILRVATSSLWASADKQLHQDQAYEAATSFGDSLDVYIRDGKIPLTAYTDNALHTIVPTTSMPALPNANITATAQGSGTEDGDITITVTAKVADAEYVYTALYTPTGARKY